MKPLQSSEVSSFVSAEVTIVTLNPDVLHLRNGNGVEASWLFRFSLQYVIDYALVWVHPIPSSSLSSPLLHWTVLQNDEGPVWKFVISSVKTSPSYRSIKIKENVELHVG